MIGAVVMFASVIVGLWTWLVRIRPYVMRSGATPITGASWGVSAWADWQQCSEFAKTHDDPRGRRLAGTFLLTQLGFAAGFILLLCGI